MVRKETIDKDKFSLSKIGKEVTEEDLKIAFELLKRAQLILNLKCKHPEGPEIKFIRKNLADIKVDDSDTELRFDCDEAWEENNWCR
jgi:hypothetical protein